MHESRDISSIDYRNHLKRQQTAQQQNQTKSSADIIEILTDTIVLLTNNNYRHPCNNGIILKDSTPGRTTNQNETKK